MASKARLGSFQELLEERAENQDIKDISNKLREVILVAFPDATEVVRLGDGAASYGVGTKKMSESHVYLMPKTGYVNLGFWHGVNIPDPTNLLEGTGKKMRHVKIKRLVDAATPQIQTLIAEAPQRTQASAWF